MIIEKGYAKSNTQINPTYRDQLDQIQENLRKNRIEIWEWSEVEDSLVESDEEDHY